MLLDRALVARLYRGANAARWGLSIEQFQGALETSCAHAFNDSVPTREQLEQYLSSLHLEDLTLAVACASGDEAAWDHFVREYRPHLYRAADAIDPTGRAHELADALHADLFGISDRGSDRKSLFRYFHGRSRLTTWLRAVLAQRHVDRMRENQRMHSLTNDDGTESEPAVDRTDDPERPRFNAAMRDALTAAIANLAPRDRLRLVSYYVHDLTLAQIGKQLGEHEATVSRQLARCRRDLRGGIEDHMRKHGLDDRTIRECFESVIDDVGALDLKELVGAAPRARKKIVAARSE